MRFFLIVALFGLAFASDLSFYKFTQYIHEYGKDYHTKEEFDYRFQAFKDNLKKIDRLNALNVAAGGQSAFSINIFADMPGHEFAQRLMKNLTILRTTLPSPLLLLMLILTGATVVPSPP